MTPESVSKIVDAARAASERLSVPEGRRNEFEAQYIRMAIDANQRSSEIVSGLAQEATEVALAYCPTQPAAAQVHGIALASEVEKIGTAVHELACRSPYQAVRVLVRDASTLMAAHWASVGEAAAALCDKYKSRAVKPEEDAEVDE